MFRRNIFHTTALRRDAVLSNPHAAVLYSAILPRTFSAACSWLPLCTTKCGTLTQSIRCASSSAFSEAASTTTSTAPPAKDGKLKIYKSKLPSVLDSVNKETTLYDYLMKRMADADPNKPAVIQADNGKVMTYPQIIEASEHAAQALYEAGVRRGDVVCICALNTTFYGPLVYGALRLGAVVSMVNAVAAASTLAYHFKANNAKVVLGMHFFQRQLEEAVDLVLRETGQQVTILFPESFFRKTNIPRIPSDYDGLKGATFDDTVALPFSSGTMGLPKGVQLTNRSLIACTEQTCAAFGIGPDAVTITVLPLFHIFGFTTCLNCISAVGATQVVMSMYSVDEYAKMIEKHRATVNMVAPPILISLMKNKELVQQRDLTSLKSFVSASAPLGTEVVRMVEAMLPGTTVAQGYGLTEMSPTVTAPVKGKSSTPGSCGRIIGDTEIRIVKVDDSQQSGADKSAGVDVQAGEEGEIWVRGPQLMKGYLRDEDTAMCMQDGWFRTGDIGKILLNTEELMITDRLKELIKYKGFQVSPAGLEALLLSHPWVKDCIVFGVPDPRDVSFENPRALVVLQPDVPTKDAVRASDELYRFVMSRMPPHKRLHGGVRIVDEISRNAAGKLMRRQMRQEELAMMKASAAETKPE
ncbi:4-coumarate:coa ligase-like protein [Leptomonas pyrrhocoris]|uniref:4-coumarate:coa ligase-like protein n=1 Tax=Leptomonas pyrrhocoris TaxID=157538 RepID=A0A0M9G5Q6_LEPPY|nr:4-coumarate:coa ligase-like protein [Leptomonas pyrrhocoris]KPA82857.1 4-coumarate:coa ligase-like protein [Leptomonas pyrrhocoris]|eukprot:XP_015661296.1 4-coumarate:coa ligase-like protein [Leptomonas pyrrhocoris]